MLTGKEIVAIIKAASSSNVAKLEVDGIRIHFKDASLYSAANMKQQAKVLKLDELTAEQAHSSPEQITMQKIFDDELLNLTDPLKFENLQLGHS